MLTGVLLAGAMTLALSPVLLALLRERQIIDTPGHRSSHTVPTVRGGGLAPALAGLGTLTAGTVVVDEPRAALLVAAGGFAAIGVAEDVRGVAPRPRLALQLVMAAAALPWLLHGLDGSPLWQAAVGLLTLVWLAGYANAFNFMDGINGISGVQVVVAGLTWYAVGLGAGVPILASASLLVAATAVGFLPFNFPTPRVFLGDVGSYFFGSWLAALVVVGIRAGVPPEAMLAPLAVCLADTSTTLLRRLRRGDAWHQAHCEHVYQRLVRLGWSHARTTGFVMAVTAVCATLGSLTVAAATPMRTAASAGVLLLLTGYLATPRLVAERRQQHSPGSPAAGAVVEARARG